MSTTTIRRPQLVANWLFFHLSSWRTLVCLAVIIVLTCISVTFNYNLGLMMGSDSITRQLFPVGFAVLDLAALFLAAWLTMKSRSIIRKGLAWTWFAYLLCLSVWAAMSFTLASDARLSQGGYEMMKDAKIRALSQAEAEVETAQRNYNNTVEYKQLRKGELIYAQEYRDKLIRDVQRLNNDNPHVSMAIYYRASVLLHNHADRDIDPKDLASIIRSLWALALTLSPFVLTALLAAELAGSGSATPNGGNRRKHDDNDEEAFSRRKTPVEAENHPNLAPAYKSSQDARNSGNDDEIELDREALTKAREWVKGQSGRVQRQQIQYRSGQSKYRQTSLIVEALEREGWLQRLSNGQLKAAKPALRVVG